MRVYKVLMILCGGKDYLLLSPYIMCWIWISVGLSQWEPFWWVLPSVCLCFFLCMAGSTMYKILPLDQVQKRELSLMNRSFLCLWHVAISR